MGWPLDSAMNADEIMVGIWVLTSPSHVLQFAASVSERTRGLFQSLFRIRSQSSQDSNEATSPEPRMMQSETPIVPITATRSISQSSKTSQLDVVPPAEDVDSALRSPITQRSVEVMALSLDAERVKEPQVGESSLSPGKQIVEEEILPVSKSEAEASVDARESFDTPKDTKSPAEAAKPAAVSLNYNSSFGIDFNLPVTVVPVVR